MIVQKRRAEQYLRVLAILKIEPRSTAQLSERMCMAKSTVRRIIQEMREANMIHISKWEKEGATVTSLYAAGKGVNAIPPDWEVERRRKCAETCTNRPLKEDASYVRIKPGFDTSRPVVCYGFWGMA